MSYLGTKPQTATDIADGIVTPADLTAGAPTWSVSGGVSLPRINSSEEGGQLNFNRASDNTGTWSIDSFGSSSTPALRIIDGANVRASFDSSGNFLFNSGYGSAAVAYGCRAWVNFNGTGTVAIRSSGNVTSITDNGTGDYTVNFTNAMSDANYATTIGARRSSGNFDNRVTTQSLATSSVRLSSVDAGGTVVDFDTIQIAVHR